MMKEFKALVITPHIPSINEVYKIANNGRYPRLYMDPSVVQFLKLVKDKLISLGLSDWAANIEDASNKCFYLHLTFGLSKKYWERDASNLVKHVEDTVASVTTINDNRNIVVSSSKIDILKSNLSSKLKDSLTDNSEFIHVKMIYADTNDESLYTANEEILNEDNFK